MSMRPFRGRCYTCGHDHDRAADNALTYALKYDSAADRCVSAMEQVARLKRQNERLRRLLAECEATLTMWSDVAPAVSLRADIRKALEAMTEERPMKTAGIFIDGWKLPIFERCLVQAGYAFEKADPLHDGTLMLRVETDNLEALGEVVKTANTEAARTGRPL